MAPEILERSDLERPDVDVTHYTYRVAWSPEDGEFVATIAELPSLSWLAGDQVAALQGLEVLVADVVSDMRAHGEEVPAPFSERTYSGKFNLRLGEDLHREIAVKAAEAQLSLNQYVVRRLLTDH